MTKLEQLIKELCPNGIEFKTLGEISKYRRGSFPQPYGNKEWYDGEGAMPFVQVADISDNLCLVSNTNRKISKKAQPKSVFAPKDSIIISLQGSIGRIAITQYDAYIDRTIAIFYDISEKLNKKYFVYQLFQIFSIKEKTARGSTIKTITKEEFTSFSIPVPPIEVQAEIVKILDEYTESVTALQQELEKELTARKKQYEYYSSKLFLDSNAPEIEMAELANFVYGYTDTAKDIGNTRFVRITDINEQGYLKQEDQKFITMTEEAKKSMLRKGDIIMARTGATFGKVLYFDSDFQSVYASFLIKIIPNERLLSRYYWHFTKTPLYWDQANKLVTTGGQPQFNTPAVKKIKIPIPPIEEQERIVSILDRFDKLCNDISEGLPAEIEARRKQYEYYRDKLLTFS